MKEGSGDGGGDNKNEEREDPGVVEMMDHNDKKNIKKENEKDESGTRDDLSNEGSIVGDTEATDGVTVGNGK